VAQALTRSKFIRKECMLKIRENQESHASLISCVAQLTNLIVMTSLFGDAIRLEHLHCPKCFVSIV
jgi:hypothetical protein